MKTDDQPLTRPIRRTSRRRIWLFRFTAAVVIPACLVLLVEAVFRVVAPGYPTSIVVPDADGEHWIDNYKFSWRFFPPALARSPQPIKTARKKPPQRLRIVVFGGSAAMGDPEAAYGMPRFLERLLRDQYPDRDIEVINAAVTAINSHVVLPITHDCRRLKADAWVVYCGNNEVHGPFGAGTVFGGKNTPLFLIRSGLALKRTSFGQFLARKLAKPDESIPKSWGGMEMFLDQTVALDDSALAPVYKNYRANLKSIITTGLRSGAAVVVGNVASNLRDCAPFVSLHRNGMTDEEIEHWKAAFDQGCQRHAAGDFEGALEAYERAATVDDHFAELSFRMGQAALAIGQTDEAKRYFEQARDLDALRFRTDTRLNQIVRDVTKQSRARFVDCVAVCAQQSSGGIPGRELFYEHVHLTHKGNYSLAIAFAEELILGLELPAPSRPWLSLEDCSRELGLTPFHEMTVLREVIGRLHAPPFTTQYDVGSQIAQWNKRIAELQSQLTREKALASITEMNDLITKYPDDWYLRKEFAALLESMGKMTEAIEQWKAVTEMLPHYAEAWAMYGMFLNRNRQREEAEQALRKAIALHPFFPRAYNSLGICLSHLGRYDEAYDAFRTAVEQMPDFSEAYVNWGMVLENQQEDEQAIEVYQKALEADPDYLPAIERLRRIYQKKNDAEAAEPYFRRLTELQPRDPNAWVNHAMVLFHLKRYEEAQQQVERALTLAPSNRQALRLYRQIQAASETSATP